MDTPASERGALSRLSLSAKGQALASMLQDTGPITEEIEDQSALVDESLQSSFIRSEGEIRKNLAMQFSQIPYVSIAGAKVESRPVDSGFQSAALGQLGSAEREFEAAYKGNSATCTYGSL